ncbi:MAG TPA: hypothetical protein VNE39_05055 [Planctomycetota bacterium]|nr:hypothetical protein [Planctomycetota bacterium]
MPTQAPEAHTRPRDRSAARASKRRRRLWFDIASWGTTVVIVIAVGLVVYWRVTSVLREDRREKQAEIEFRQALRGNLTAPADLDRAADRLRALIAAYPDTESARKAQAELANLEKAREAHGNHHP